MLNEVNVKCIFCGGYIKETEVNHHLEHYHKIQSLFINPKYKEVGTDAPDRDSQNNLLSHPTVSIEDSDENSQESCVEGRSEEVSEESITPVVLSSERKSAGEQSLERFRCPICHYFADKELKVVSHIGTHQNAGKSSKLSLKRKSNDLQKIPVKQKMKLILEKVEIPCAADPAPAFQMQEISGNSDKIKSKRTSPDMDDAEKRKANKKKRGRPRKRKIPVKKSEVEKVEVESNNNTSGSPLDTSIEIISVEDHDCVILEQVINSPVAILSDSEQTELKHILENHVKDEEDTPDCNTSVMSPTPGPSRPYPCPDCLERFDTWTPLQQHVNENCPGYVRSESSDLTGSSSHVSTRVSTCHHQETGNSSRDIKTDNMQQIKSNVSNVYVRFVQTYFSSYKRKFPELSSADLIQKMREGYTILRNSNNPCIVKLQQEYEQERRVMFDSKIRTIVKCLEEDGCADFKIDVNP